MLDKIQKKVLFVNLFCANQTVQWQIISINPHCGKSIDEPSWLKIYFDFESLSIDPAIWTRGCHEANGGGGKSFSHRMHYNVTPLSAI